MSGAGRVRNMHALPDRQCLPPKSLRMMPWTGPCRYPGRPALLAADAPAAGVQAGCASSRAGGGAGTKNPGTLSVALTPASLCALGPPAPPCFALF